MLFRIHCLDKADRKALRDQHFQARRDYLNVAPFRLVIAGPLLADGAAIAIGSLFGIDAEHRRAAESFNRNAPFHKAGIWSDIHICVFKKRSGDRLGPGPQARSTSRASRTLVFAP